MTDLLKEKTSQMKREFVRLHFLQISLFLPLFHDKYQLGDMDTTYLEVLGKHLSSHCLVGRKAQHRKSTLNQKTCLTLSFPWDVVWANLFVIDSLRKAKMSINNWGDDPCYSIPHSTFLFGPCPGIGREIVLCFIVEFRYKRNCHCCASTQKRHTVFLLFLKHLRDEPLERWFLRSWQEGRWSHLI